MLFVSQISVDHEKMTEAIKLLKKPSVPDGIQIQQSVWMFGKPDALVVFTAKDESVAGKFVIQFSSVGMVATSAAFPIDKLGWIG